MHVYCPLIGAVPCKMESSAGPSYTQYRSSELSEPTSSGFSSSGPSSSSSGAESTNTATTEVPGSASEEEKSDIALSLLDKLKAPKPSTSHVNESLRQTRLAENAGAVVPVELSVAVTLRQSSRRSM